MKPDFTLDFRDNQIALLHRQEAGWAAIGRVAMDDPDLDAAMGYLRATALGLSPRGISTKLILPNEAILYTNLPNLSHEPAHRAAQIAEGLRGRTPYDVADLVWDWTDRGASADVAVIARETLAEAEGFAAQHRFNPISFAAIPNSGGFEGEVWFGPSDLSQTLLASGEVVERDEAFAYAPPPEDAPSAQAEASDFEMGAGARTALMDAPATAAVPDGASHDSAQTTAPAEAQVPAQPDQREVWQDFLGNPPPASTDIHDAAQQPEQPTHDMPSVADAPLPLDQPDLDSADTRQVESLDKNPAQPVGTPSTFDDVMQDVAREDADAQDADTQSPDSADEAPIALDVPLIDTVDAAPISSDDRPDPKGEFGEKPPSKAEQMLAAFAARRAAALAKAEAAANGARIEPMVTAPAATAPAGVALASIEPPAQDRSPDLAPDAAAANPTLPPKLGSASAALGKPPDIMATTGLKPAVIKHIPAKDLPKSPQNLKAMPKPTAARRGLGLGWILTAALLLALVAGAALSSYVLESVNRLFFDNTTVASTELQAERPAIALPASNPAETVSASGQPSAAPRAADVAITPTEPKQAQAALAALQLPSLPAYPPLPDAALAAADRDGANAAEAAEAGVTIAATQSTPAGAAAPPLSVPAQTQPVAVALPSAPSIAITDGPPPVVPSPRPSAIVAIAANSADVASAAGNAAFADPALANARPLPRPQTIAPAPAANAVPFADPALAEARPLARPSDILAAGRAARLAAAPASLVASAEINAAEQALIAASASAAPPAALDLSPLALSISRVPAARPQGLAAAAAAAAARQAEIAAAASIPPEADDGAAQTASARPPEEAEAEAEEEVTNAGGVASRSVVAQQATFRNALNLNDVNLVGVFGSNANRYALIRQPSGAFRKLKVGDRFDGGRVAAITESEVRYAKGGEMLALRMPRS